MWDPLRPKYPKKYKNPKYLAKKNEKRKKNNRERLGRDTSKHVCRFSGSISQKRGGHWTLKEIGVYV